MKIDGIDKVVAFGQENADAMVKSGTAALKGFEELSRAGQALATRQVEKTDAAVKAMLSCKNPVELADLQGRLARESIETVIAEGRRFAELTTSLYTAALEPWNARIAAFQSLTRSAA